MPRKEYSWDVRELAEAMYVEQGLTYEEIAGKTHVSLNTLKAWGLHGDWKGRKKQRFQTRKTLTENLEQLRVRALQSAMADPDVDPKKLFAVIKLEKLALDREQSLRKALDDQQAGPSVDRPRIFLEDLEFIVEVLRVEDPEGLKILSKSFDLLVSRAKEKYAAAA